MGKAFLSEQGSSRGTFSLGIFLRARDSRGGCGGGLDTRAMSCFRKRVFSELPLSDMGQRGRHGLEGVEFSWRVSKNYQLKVTPSARLAYYSRGRDPKNAMERGRRQLLNHGSIFLIHGEKGAWVWAKFVWGSIGVIVGNMEASLLFRDPRERMLRLRMALGNLLGLLQFILLRG